MSFKAATSAITTVLLILACKAAWAGIPEIEREGTRDGKKYAQDLRRNGILVDGTACAVGMAAEDLRRPNFTQVEIEAYAKAFGNACAGRKIH